MVSYRLHGERRAELDHVVDSKEDFAGCERQKRVALRG
jgi:hypothetical protein